MSIINNKNLQLNLNALIWRKLVKRINKQTSKRNRIVLELYWGKKSRSLLEYFLVLLSIYLTHPFFLGLHFQSLLCTFYSLSCSLLVFTQFICFVAVSCSCYFFQLVLSLELSYHLIRSQNITHGNMLTDWTVMCFLDWS